MGLGKTHLGAFKSISFHNKVLVVCQHSKILDWVEHFTEYYNRQVFNLTKKKELDLFLQTDNSIGIINYDLIWRRDDLKLLGRFTLMLDESSLIATKTAKRTKFILNLKPSNIILLSGTPACKYEKLWTQAHLLGFPDTERQFINRYCIEDVILNWQGKPILNPVTNRPLKKIVGYQCVEELKERFKNHGAVFMKTEEVFDLPTQNYIEVKVNQTLDYRKFKKDKILIKEDKEFVGDNSLKKRLCERQLCSIYHDEKLEQFKSLIESTSNRVVVFYNFKDEFVKLKKICESLDKPISYINGSGVDKTNYDYEVDSVTLCQYQAASKGHNLQKANVLIYYSPTESADDWQQSQKRIHRLGQVNPCFYYELIVRGSVEEKIYRSIRLGQDYTLALYEKEENE